jgi:Nucleotidyl transferase AbiEii toxin, Type IV TA system
LKEGQPKNLVASIHQRLLNHAKLTKDEPQLVLMRFCLERLMFRLSESEHSSEFVVKGAMLFLIWTGEPHRATKDLDLLSLKSASLERLQKMFQDLCRVAVVDDGLSFLPESVQAAEIQENAVYEGIRVTIEARLGNARIPLQVDIGFGDVVTPKARDAVFPPLLDFPAPHLHIYPKETVVAEKFEAMVKLGLLNSRMKDFYDIWALCQAFEFEGEILGKAVQATFKRRKTELPADLPLALTAEFSSDATKQRQYQAFIKRGRLKLSDSGLEKVIAVLRGFLGPVLSGLGGGSGLKKHWPKGGPWKAEK